LEYQILPPAVAAVLARGKPRKVALVACMNKRLNYLNGLLKTNTTL
jgi:hypothetical protein